MDMNIAETLNCNDFCSRKIVIKFIVDTYSESRADQTETYVY